MRLALAWLLALVPGCGLSLYTVGGAQECASATMCEETCPEGQVLCGGACTPADACPCELGCDGQREVCADGVCVCREGLTRCGANCADTRTDPAHCGGCDGVCEGAEGLCQDKDCVGACGAPLQACEGACVDVSHDSLHCGGCDQPCQPDEVCVAGTCRGYSNIPGCTACPCENSCGEDTAGDTDVGGDCCDSPFLGVPVCVSSGCD